MNNRKSLRSALGILFLLVACIAGIFSLSGCQEECTEHDFDTWPLTVTCTEDGLMARNCKKCGYYDEVEAPAMGHSFSEWSIVTSATCHSVGERRRSCDCGETETEEIPMLKHTVDSWVATKDPTATEEGSARGYCTANNCSAMVTVTLPVVNEENYDVEFIDSESKICTLKNSEYAPSVYISNYYFTEKTVNNQLVGYYIGAKRHISTEKLVIPSTHDGYPVIGIISESFMNQTDVKELVISEGIEEVGESIFYGCSESLAKVTLPSTIKEFGNDTWWSGGGSAFSYKITDIYYNGTVEDWCKIKFYGQPNAENVYFLNENNEYELLTEVTVPASVTAIGDYQFNGIKSLTTVNMHSNITSIGTYAFSATGLTSFIMPDSVTSIGASAFSSCRNLEEIKLSENIEVIDRYAFFNCTSLTSISIPSKVTNIEYWAFYGCETLSEVKIKADSLLENIGKESFFNCNALTALVVPQGVTAFGISALPYNCKTFYYMGSANSFQNISGFNVSDATVHYYSAGVPMSSDYTYWRFIENDTPAIWVAGTFTSGKEFVYSNTETTVTDQYWGMLKAAESQGMLEMFFPSSELGPVLAQQQIEMVTSSTTKAQYEQKLCAFSASNGQGTSYKFENGKVTMTINGQPQPAINYVEFDNVIYVGNGQPLCYIDADNNRIYEKNETEYNTVWLYYEPASNS